MSSPFPIRQNATHKVPVTGFVDVTDGFTVEAGVTLSGADDASAILHDNATVVDIGAYTWAAIANSGGDYHLTLQTAISSTVGPLVISVNRVGEHRPVRAEFMVIEEAVYDRDYSDGATGVISVSSSGSALNFAVTYDNTTTDTIDNAAAVDKGSGLVGIPVTGHAFEATREVTIADTTNYNGAFTIVSESTNEVVITASYISETFGGTETIVSSVAGVVFTGSQTGTFANTKTNPATFHQIDDDTNVLNMIHVVECGPTHTSVSVVVDAYLNGNGDSLTLQLYDHVGDAWDTFETIAGKSGSALEEFSLLPLQQHTGAIGSTDAGRVFVRYGSTSTNPTLFLARVIAEAVASTSANVGEEIWADSNQSNTNTVPGTDGRPELPVSSMAAVNTLLVSANLHQVSYAPGSSFTFAAGQTDETHMGRDWTLALGGQDITGSFFFGSIVSGTATATGRYEFEECDLMACTLDNDGLFERCSISGTQTVGQAGVFTYHNCYNESGSEITIDFGGLGATTVHLFQFHGEINFTNMASGDIVHITGAGTITTTTCTAGTIEHDGFFQYTDAGGNITEEQSDIKAAVDAVLVDTASLNDGAISELSQGAPSATPTLQNAVMLIYMMVRNKLVGQTSGVDAIEVHNDAGTLIAKKLVTDDDQDYTEDQMISGA